MSTARRLLLGLGLLPGLLLSLPSLGWAADPLESQVLELRLGRGARVRLDHTPGDQVAILRFQRPPVDLLELLNQQRGALFKGATRLGGNGEVEEVGLELARPELGVRLQLAKKSGRMTVTLAEPLAPPPLAPDLLIGRIPTLIPVAVAPAVLPPLPKGHPCPTRGPADKFLRTARRISTSQQATLIAQVVEEPCRSFVIGERARYVLDRHERIDSELERWAFMAVRVGRWARYPAAHAHTSLIAANVLTETGLFAEAEALLLADKMIKAQSLAPYVAYSLARLYARNQRPAEAEELLSKLVAETSDSELLAAGWTLRVEAAERDGDHARALALVRQARSKIDERLLPPSIFLRGAELALVTATSEEARTLFEKAAELGERRARAHAELRLGDLAVAAGGPRWPKVAEAHYLKVDPPDACFEQLLELRRFLGRRLPKDKLLASLERLSAPSLCSPVRAEAIYAQARLYAQWGHEREALALVDGLRPEGGWPAGMRPSLERLEEDVAASLLGRRARERRFEEVLDLAAGPLGAIVARLPAREQSILAEACLEVGVPDQAEAILLPLLKRSPEDRVHLSELLARAYLDHGALDRARLVLNYLAVQPGADRFFVRAGLARQDLASGKPLEALRRLDEKPGPPAGNATATLELLRAEALSDLGRADEAAQAYLLALESGARDRHGLAVRVISSCARGCSEARLRRLLEVVRVTQPSYLEGDRVAWLLAQRGIPTATVADGSGSIWSRLRALDPEPSTGSP